MKVLTLTGTRPELIRLSVTLRKLDEMLGVNHIHVFTNQNFDPNLSTIFLQELGIREPNYTFDKTDGLGMFLGNGFTQFASILDREKPDRVLVLGDTNSALLALLAAKLGIPVYHMEAGNRCFDKQVPEETNRRIVDSFATYNLPYTKNSKENLIREGYHKNYVFQTGNPIYEVLLYYQKQIENSTVLDRLGLYTGFEQVKYDVPYILLSLHRTENVDNPIVARNIVDAINFIAEENNIKVILPFHPHTRDQFEKHGIYFSKMVECIEPIGFFDFVKLEQCAKVVITDSGTVPEETHLLDKPCIVLRNTIERQELIETGSLILAGTEKADIIRAYHSIDKMEVVWPILEEYSKITVSDTVIRILMGA